jgi:hypothetical protein
MLNEQARSVGCCGGHGGLRAFLWVESPMLEVLLPYLDAACIPDQGWAASGEQAWLAGIEEYQAPQSLALIASSWMEVVLLPQNDP